MSRCNHVKLKMLNEDSIGSKRLVENRSIAPTASVGAIAYHC